MARMPEATWQPKAVPGRAARRKGRCIVLHVAVSEAQSLMPGPNADWHFYVAKDGRIYQYIDTDVQSWATGAANPTAISVETQGGVRNADGEPWTDAQVRSLAKLCRWAHDTEGIPLELMANSLPATRGVGFHRLGVDPWRVAGGELWSSSRGKICPGAAKIAQIPHIIALAQQEEDMPLSNDDIAKIARAVWEYNLGATKGGTADDPVDVPAESAKDRVNAIRRAGLHVRDRVAELLKGSTPPAA